MQAYNKADIKKQKLIEQKICVDVRFYKIGNFLFYQNEISETSNFSVA